MNDQQVLCNLILNTLHSHKFWTSAGITFELKDFSRYKVERALKVLSDEGRVSRKKMGKNKSYIYWVELANIEPVPEPARVRCDPVIGNDVSYSAWGHLVGFINKSSWWHWIVVAIVVVLPWVLVANKIVN